MPKLQDIVPAGKRRPAEIKPKPKPITKTVVTDTTPEYRYQERTIPEYEVEKEYTYTHTPRHRRKSTLWGAVAFTIVVLFFSLVPFFSKATVWVTPKTKQFTLTTQPFTASRHAPIGALPFEVMALSGDDELTVSTATETEIATKAAGTIVLYNEFSDTPQKLAKDTRVEGSNGKIYKTTAAVTIPGKEDETPGSIEAGIVAEATGSGYNSSPIDFTLPSFAGTSKFEKIYARSKGDIIGGAAGTTYTLNDEDKKRLQETVLPALKQRLENQAKVQIPEGYILYPTATLFVPSDELEASVGDMGTVIKQKATLYAFLFQEERLAMEIAKKEKFTADAVRIPTLRDLVFALKDPNIPSPTTLDELGFTLSGQGILVAAFDAEEIKKDVRGRAKQDLALVVDNHPSVAEMKGRISPFWRIRFPEDVEDIKITEVLPSL